MKVFRLKYEFFVPFTYNKEVFNLEKKKPDLKILKSTLICLAIPPLAYVPQIQVLSSHIGSHRNVARLHLLEVPFPL